MYNDVPNGLKVIRRVNSSESSALTATTIVPQQVPLLSGIAYQDCQGILAQGHKKSFGRGHLFFIEGDPVGQVYLLVSGYVKLTRLSRAGTEVTVCLDGPGQFVGALDLFSHGAHRESGAALRACTVLVWDSAMFHPISKRYPILQQNAARMLSTRLQELQERFLELSTEKVNSRLARQLRRLAEQVGRRSDAGVEISLSRAELADMIGTTLFTVSRILCEWEHHGWVSTRREAVLIHGAFWKEHTFAQICDDELPKERHPMRSVKAIVANNPTSPSQAVCARAKADATAVVLSGLKLVNKIDRY
jgi:CRP-like cAMP-binding protein